MHLKLAALPSCQLQFLNLAALLTVRETVTTLSRYVLGRVQIRQRHSRPLVATVAAVVFVPFYSDQVTKFGGGIGLPERQYNKTIYSV